MLRGLHALAKAHDLLSLKSWDRAPVRDIVGAALGAFPEAHRERFLIEHSKSSGNTVLEFLFPTFEWNLNRDCDVVRAG